MVTPPVTLQHGAWRLDVAPHLGGSVLGLWHGATPVLRPAPLGASHAGETAAFPLVPYSNRIGKKSFNWNGHRYTVETSFDGGPNALHGIGFMRPWTVLAKRASHLQLRLDHPGDADWPFAFEAEQHFDLHEHGLTVRLSLRSTDDRTQPAGLGWHPYFLRRDGTVLQGAGVNTHWLCGDDLLPTQPLPCSALIGPVAQHPLDHCFSGGEWFGLADSVMSVVLHASSHHWVVFTPPDSDYLCIEPVTHVSNAVQMSDPLAHGLVALASGETLTQTIDLQVSFR